MSKRLLLCDDEAHILRAAEFKFKRAGYQVQCACDGEEAWECIQNEKPDLLITDCQMPRLNGIDLAKRVHEHPDTSSIPIIMLTAKGYELSRQQLANDCGILDILTKPFSPRELLRLVQQMLGDPQGASLPGQVWTDNSSAVD